MSRDDHSPTASSAAQAGRGGLALTAGKLFFLVSGLVQQVLLKAVLNLNGYGALSTSLSIASIAYNPMVQAGIQGVSRETAAVADEKRPFVLRQLLVVHGLLSCAAALIFFFAAAPIARAIGAAHVTFAVQILAGVLFLYGLYAPLVGALNGSRRFVAQAGLDAWAASLRTVGLLGGAWLGTRALASGAASSGVVGTTTGFVAAAVVILCTALIVTGIGKKGADPAQPTPIAVRRYLPMILAVWGGQLLLNLLFQADALLLRRFAADAAQAAQLAETEADTLVGAYRACQLFCFLPFQLLTSLTFVLFPLLAAARSQQQHEEVTRLIERGVRLAIVLTSMMVAVLLALPQGLLALVFGAETADLGAPCMRILAVGMGAFAILGVMTSALNSLGKERVSLSLFFVAVLAVGLLCGLFALGQGLGPALLVRVASGTTVAMLLSAAVAAFALARGFQARPPVLSLVRSVASAGAAAAVTSQLVGKGAVWTLLGAALCTAVYLLLLVASRELTTRDLSDLRGVLVRKAKDSRV